MHTDKNTLIDLEKKFWQSMVDNDTDTALGLLAEPSLMVSPHGAMQFDHDAYRQMAEHGSMVLTSFELSDIIVVMPTDGTAVLSYHVKQSMSPRGKNESTVQEMNDTSTWARDGQRWLCVLHTETPSPAGKAN